MIDFKARVGKIEDKSGTFCHARKKGNALKTKGAGYVTEANMKYIPVSKLEQFKRQNE